MYVVPLFAPDREEGELPYNADSPGIRRTTISTYPDDRARLAELVAQMALSDPDAPRCTMSEAVRTAVDYTLSYAFGMGDGDG